MSKKKYDCINLLRDYIEIEKETSSSCLKAKEELAYCWFAENVCNCTFYDDEIACKWGKFLFRTIKDILNRTTIMLEQLYEEYLICLNLIGESELEWGTSIRHCWFLNEKTEEYYKKRVKQMDRLLSKTKEGE